MDRPVAESLGRGRPLTESSRMLGKTILAAVAALICAGPHHAGFSADERQAVVELWRKPGTFSVSAPDDVRDGVWKVRLTAEASQWLWNYNHARGLGKTPPTQIPAAQNELQHDWDAWIDAKVAHDRWEAAETAKLANSQVMSVVSQDQPEPPDPGPEPQSLIDLAGNAPSFACAAAPLKYTVKFEDGLEISYTDQVPMRARYAYFRFPQGVMSAGSPVRDMPADELDSLLQDAGIDESQGRVMKAVSLLEGGFDSINTYDTGYLSVGLIQFATLSGGGGSLGDVMMRMKKDTPEAFDRDFRRFGIDVSDAGLLDVVDPETGVELTGPDAVRKVIDDKRLTAPFQRAGQRTPFRIAQLRTAKDDFYPADDPVSVNVAGQPVAGKVSDFVHSEAGMATLMDRKVNTGKLDPLQTVLDQLVAQLSATQVQIKALTDLAPYERDIDVAMKYRKDYLADTSLSQPPMPPVHRPFSLTSRSGGRGTRKAHYGSARRK